MGIIELYIIFAVTTAIVTLYELVWPVIRSIKEENSELNVSRHWLLTICVFFIMSTVMAPVLLIPCLWPRKGEQFRKTLYVQLKTGN